MCKICSSLQLTIIIHIVLQTVTKYYDFNHKIVIYDQLIIIIKSESIQHNIT